jgi:hypothetical protein
MAMSENPEDKPGSVEQSPDTQPEVAQLGRRLFVFKAAAVLGGAAAAVLGTSREAPASDFGSGHKDPAGQYHVQDGSRRRPAPEDDDPDD